jgi:colicin import membrane protein
MEPKLKVFRTHLGFYDMIVAAPSQKAALAAWGGGPHLFAQGFATVETDPRLAAEALKKPGVALRRQFGSKGAFAETGGPLQAPKLNAADAAAGRENKKKKSAEAERIAKAGHEEAAVAERIARRERHGAAQLAREGKAEDRAGRATASRQRKQQAAMSAARKPLQASLDTLVKERKKKLREIERREDALARERREIEQSFETRIVASQKALRKARGD